MTEPTITTEAAVDWGYVLGAALRYQLPRMTYGSGIVADAIIAAWPILTQREHNGIVREIHYALDTDRAGMACDREAWQRVLDHAEAAGG